MFKYLKYVLWLLLFIVVFAAGAWLTYTLTSKPKISVEEQSNVLLEKIETVAKLVSVEGFFSEIYSYKDDWEPVPNPIYSPKFSKKALIIVKAKVSVGYDLEKMTIEADHARKVISIGNIPEPEIISIDHDLKYYDMEESTFNTFSKGDLTKLNRSAKEFIRKKAEQGDLLPKAKEQGNRMLEIIEFMVKESGWTVEYEHAGDYPELDGETIEGIWEEAAD